MSWLRARTTQVAAAVGATFVAAGVALLVFGAHHRHPPLRPFTPVGRVAPSRAVAVAAPPRHRHHANSVKRVIAAHPMSTTHESGPRPISPEPGPAPATGSTNPPPTTEPSPAAPPTTAPASTNVATPTGRHTTSSGMSIEIPAIGVHAAVVTVGVGPDHTIAVPPLTRPHETAWYDGSARPGQDGAAVILGHVDTAATGAAVFYDLSKLQPGDRVTIMMRRRGSVTYRVDGLREYPKTSVPAAGIFGPLPYPGLRLITCGGAFDYQTGHYVDNIVVYASIVS